MSGGRFSYKEQSLCYSVFNYDIQVLYDLAGEKAETNRLRAMRDNPLGDKRVSALIYDVLSLLHSYDYYVSGDTSKDCYINDLNYIRSKYLKIQSDKVLEDYVESRCSEIKEQILSELRPCIAKEDSRTTSVESGPTIVEPCHLRVEPLPTNVEQ